MNKTIRGDLLFGQAKIGRSFPQLIEDRQECSGIPQGTFKRRWRLLASALLVLTITLGAGAQTFPYWDAASPGSGSIPNTIVHPFVASTNRSEERRVGK